MFATKKVVDFTDSSATEFAHAMYEAEGKLCGRFLTTQTATVREFRFDKAAVVLATSAFVFAAPQVYAQGDPLPPDTTIQSTTEIVTKPANGLVKKEHVPNRTPIPYATLGEPNWTQYPLAEYPGDTLKSFIRRNIYWPDDVSLDFSAIVLIVIDSTGKVVDVSISRTTDSKMVKEIIRAAKTAMFLPPKRDKGVFDTRFGQITVVINRKDD